MRVAEQMAILYHYSQVRIVISVMHPMASSSTVTSKGQATIPKAIRDQLNLKTGDRVEFVVEEDGRVVLVPATIHVSELRGIMPRPRKTASLEEMDTAIEAGAGAKLNPAK